MFAAESSGSSAVWVDMSEYALWEALRIQRGEGKRVLRSDVS